MLFDYYLLHTVPKDVVREALNNLIVRCDQLWVFGNLSLGVKVQIGIAKRLGKPVRYYDITDLPYRVVERSRDRWSARSGATKDRGEAGGVPPQGGASSAE